MEKDINKGVSLLTHSFF